MDGMKGSRSVNVWVCVWGDYVWVFGYLELIIRLFYGFGGWIYECGATARCFMGFWVSLGVSLGV